MPETPLLEVQGLYTHFHTEEGTARAVDGVSFSVFAGQTLAVVGESGCGKSVTSMSIMRLLQVPPADYAGGRILYKGRDLLTLPEKEMQRIRGGEIAMIFQEPMTSLNPVFTVGDQIIEAINLHQAPPQDAAGRIRPGWQVEIAEQALRRVGISEPRRRLSEYPHQMSGGMKQRVMIAMALACEPSVLIADEPTTALDVTIQAQILELMREIQQTAPDATNRAAEAPGPGDQNRGMGILLITHDLGVVAENADVVAVMYAGKIVEYADVNELFEHPMHPYTKGLLACVPRLGQRRQDASGKLFTIPGMVPPATRYPRGCRFAARCTECTGDVRRKEEEAPPELREVKSGHWVASWSAPGYASAQATEPRLSYRRPATPAQVVSA